MRLKEVRLLSLEDSSFSSREITPLPQERISSLLALPKIMSSSGVIIIDLSGMSNI